MTCLACEIQQSSDYDVEISFTGVCQNCKRPVQHTNELCRYLGIMQVADGWWHVFALQKSGTCRACGHVILSIFVPCDNRMETAHPTKISKVKDTRPQQQEKPREDERPARYLSVEDMKRAMHPKSRPKLHSR